MLPHALTCSDNFNTLSPRAMKLLIQTIARYRGKNNGDFDFSLKTMKKIGWNSNDQITKAKKELMDKGWIVLTRQGGRNQCNLYAITIWAIDDCNGKLDRKPSVIALAYWKLGRNPEGEITN